MGSGRSLWSSEGPLGGSGRSLRVFRRSVGATRSFEAFKRLMGVSEKLFWASGRLLGGSGRSLWG